MSVSSSLCLPRATLASCVGSGDWTQVLTLVVPVTNKAISPVLAD